ncbi:MAG: hypothetical protein DMG58_22610 [Acidobacteria bacterium]|nr:MAG: hypothetical protein DMG58_22610 [Acidobacteriota bacterium]
MTPSGQHVEILAASFARIGQTAIEITISPSEVQHSPKQARIATSSSITIPSSIAMSGLFGNNGSAGTANEHPVAVARMALPKDGSADADEKCSIT